MLSDKNLKSYCGDTEDSAKKDYKQSIVVFLDLLGFTKLIESIDKESSNEKDIQRIFEILQLLDAFNTKDGVNISAVLPKIEFSPELKDKSIDFEKLQDELKIAYFSDSLVITLSYDENEFDDRLLVIVLLVAYLQSGLAMANFFSRGGIAIGRMYHKDNIFFGKAYLDAIELEKIAIYPRVILSSDIEKMQKKSNKKIPYIKKVEDGLWYIDFLDYAKNIRNSSVCIQPIQDNIEQSISASLDNLKIRAKYTWLMNHQADSNATKKNLKRCSLSHRQN